MSKHRFISQVLPLGVILLAAAFSRAADVPPLAAAESTGPMRGVVERYSTDLDALERSYGTILPDASRDRLRRFYEDQLKALGGVNFDSLDSPGRIDYLLLRNKLRFQAKELEHDAAESAETAKLVPFAKAVTDLEAARRRMEPADAEASAKTLTDIRAQAAAARKAMGDKLKDGGDAKSVADWVVANRAAQLVDGLRTTLRRWYDFHAGYSPEFSWWLRQPYPQLDKELDEYATFLRRRLAGFTDGEDAPVIGNPIGRQALLDALEAEMIPYTPEELIDLANQEFAWCDVEMKKAARDLGCGDDWHKALDLVSARHMKPGEQPKLIKDLADEATKFVEDRGLVTVPDLCKETWRMEMMTPRRQKVNPYFTGGEVISVSYPTDDMSHEDKLMSMRGNNAAFCRATVFHELIPGHHLQIFMGDRYNAHRKAFRTPFLVEGWALYWEMVFWDKNFPRSAEDRVGMLFWRAHRCARIIFSLKFHLGQMTAQEAINFIVDRVGHERRNATAEVRRSVAGAYEPLYQAAYMLGGLQLRALRKELVDTNKLTERQFHDAILRENAISVDLIRASLARLPLDKDYKATWRFYDVKKTDTAATTPAAGAGEVARVYRDRVEPNWFGGGKKFWYRNDLPGGKREFVVVDGATGERKPAFDHARLAAALGKVTNAPAVADALPVQTLEFAGDGKSVELRGRAGAWRLDLSDYQLAKVGGDKGEPDKSTLPASLTPRPSRRTGPETNITFVNDTAEDVELFWLSESGGRDPFGTLKAGERKEQHTFTGHTWLVARKDGSVSAVFEATELDATAVVGARGTVQEGARGGTGRGARGGTGRGGARGPTARSPDGKWEAFARDHNLFLRDTKTGDETQLTKDGTDKDTYHRDVSRQRGVGMNYDLPEAPPSAPDVRWSPDSKRLVAMRTHTAPERKVYLVESSPRDQVQPKLQSYPYLKPGDEIPVLKPHLFDVEDKKEIPVGDELFPTPFDVGDLRWAGDSKEFTFLYNQRGHQVLRIVGVDAETGKARAVVDEHSDTFIDYSGKQFSEYLPGTKEIVWMSERDGWCHLYLYDAATGAVKNQITKGEWVVRGVDRVDPAKRQIWFRAGGIRPGQDPYFVHFCRVNFDGSSLTILTEGNGNHTIQFSPDRTLFIDTWSRVDMPPVNELRSAEDGKLVSKLEESEWGGGGSNSTPRNLPEAFVAKARDGTTDIYGVIYRPRDFDPAKKYPVIENIYAGPQSAYVPKSFRAVIPQQRLADAGFVVVQMDGMGTSLRSKKFHDVSWKNLADAGFPDRIAWMKAAAAKYPYMDLSRVGVYGGSAGGQNALGALLTHGEFYKAAVADSGCHDNRMDKIWWNEQWMGYPVGPHYDEQSNVTMAPQLQGKLLLMAGELDKNVDPASTMQVVNALIRANKDFDLVIVPGAGHGVSGSPYGRRRVQDFFVRHLLSGLTADVEK